MKTTPARFLAYGVLLAVLAALCLSGAALVRKRKQELMAAPRYGARPIAVHVAVARRGNLRETRSYLAVISADRVASVSARLTSTVEKVEVTEGDRVAAGAVLLLLDGTEIQDEIASVEARIKSTGAELAANEATVGALEASVAYWNREAERDRKLAGRRDIAVSRADATAEKLSDFKGQLDAAKQRSNALRQEGEALKEECASLKTRLGYCTIRSPGDGIVTHKLVDPGDLASPGRTLVVVEDRSRLKVNFDVPQEDLPEVHAGLPVRFRVEGEERTAVLSRVYPSLDASRTVQAQVYLDGLLTRGLTTGAYLPLRVVLAEHEGATLVPFSALVDSPRDGHPYVFAVQRSRLKATPVRILAYEGDRAALAGIAPGTRVVTSTFLGWARLAGGMKVEAIR